MRSAAVQLIGDEMLGWSDLDATHGPGPARGAALLPFLRAARGRVLVAGPHHPDLLDALELDTVDDVTVLVRGVPDAETLAGRDALSVLCGSPAKLAAHGPFDTVVALAGLERLDTAESDGLAWTELLGLVRVALAPDALLILGVENPLGLHRLVAAPAQLTDADWVAVTDDSKPASLTKLRQAVGAVARVYCAYPGLLTPQVILEEDAEGGAAEAALSRAFSGTSAALADPAKLAIDSVRHGVGPAIAPGWIIVASSAEDLLPDVGCEPVVAPPGPTLESCLLRAAAIRDLPTVRALMTAWLDGPAAGVPAGQVICAAGGDLVALAAGGDPVEALRGLASRLLRAGFPHPWPAVTGTADLTRTLAAMAGRRIEVPDAGEAPDLPFAELLAERERLTRELADARAQAAFFEAELTVREQDLRRTRRMVELLSGTGPARAGRAFVGGVRAARRVLRRHG